MCLKTLQGEEAHIVYGEYIRKQNRPDSPHSPLLDSDILVEFTFISPKISNKQLQESSPLFGGEGEAW